jgi:HNH endonuclease
MAIPKALFQLVRQRAQFRCEYCHYPELLSSAPLSIDHLRPQSLGGSDDPANLALATCNRLDLNDDQRAEPFIQNARRKWLLAGLHPSVEDQK